MSLELTCVKEEPEWEDTSGQGVSEAAARAGLYLKHEVLDDVVIGPEVLQPPDVVFGMRVPGSAWALSQPGLVSARAREQLTMTCSTQPRTSPHQSSLTTPRHVRAEQQTERMNECDLPSGLRAGAEKYTCGEQFMQKSNIVTSNKNKELIIKNAGENIIEIKLEDSSKLSQFKLLNNTDVQGVMFEKPSESKLANYTQKNIGNNFICVDSGKDFCIKSELVKHTHTHFPKDGKNEDLNSKKKEFTCNTCNVTFITNMLLLEHGKQQHDVKYFACNECEYATKRAYRLQNHKRTHTKEKPFRCSQCDAAFSQQSSLRVHQRVHTGEKPYKCSQCDAAFSQRNHLRGHQRIHTGEKPFICNQCVAAFSHQSSLRVHQRVHTGEKPFKCNHCDAIFSQRHHLRGHQRIHTGEKPFMCRQCNAAFTDLSNLRSHQRIHTGEKPFKCSQCDATFSQYYHLGVHQRIHTGEKPFKCSQCDAAFSQQSTLQRHQRTHTGEKPFKCSECDAAFSRKSTLQVHQRTHTRETF